MNDRLDRALIFCIISAASLCAATFDDGVLLTINLLAMAILGVAWIGRGQK